ncbi:hypothetical protein KKHLCK_11205 [Candidatus Electrothrix laxa]
MILFAERPQLCADRLCITMVEICPACKGVKAAIGAFVQTKRYMEIEAEIIH